MWLGGQVATFPKAKVVSLTNTPQNKHYDLSDGCQDVATQVEWRCVWPFHTKVSCAARRRLGRYITDVKFGSGQTDPQLEEEQLEIMLHFSDVFVFVALH